MASKTKTKRANKNTDTLKKYIAGIGLAHLKEVDLRTAAILHNNGILKKERCPILSKLLDDVILNPDHPSRIQSSPGPLVFYKNVEQPSRLVASPIMELLFSRKVKVRRAALLHFEQNLSDLLTPRSRKLLVEFREDLQSRKSSCWNSSAIKISDAIVDDWLCNLAGVRQCLERQFEEGAKHYLNAIISPTLSSVDSIDPKVFSPCDHKEETEKWIVDTAESAEEFIMAVDRYYYTYGHLPLSKPLSLCRVLEEWIGKKGEIQNVWNIIWAWADGISSPLPRYHACQLFANNPNLIPKGEESKLWDEIVEIVHLVKSEESDLRWTQMWRVRCELARHFCRWFECQAPGLAGDRIAVMSWWLSEQTSQTLDTFADVVGSLWNNNVIPKLELSKKMRCLAHPPVRSSVFHHASVFLTSTWALSLLCQLSEGLTALRPRVLNSDNWDRIRTSIEASTLNAFPLKPKSDDKAIYAFECTVLPTARRWADLERDEEKRESLRVYMNIAGDFAEPNKCKEHLKSLIDLDNNKQMLIAIILRTMAYTGELSADLMWELVSDKEWREKLLLKSSLDVLGTVFNALAELQVQHEGKWVSEWPHFLVSACEEPCEDPERKKLLFAFVIASSVNTGTVSAIERLLSGKQRKQFLEEVPLWRKHFEDLWKDIPCWIRARFRGTMASIAVAQ